MKKKSVSLVTAMGVLVVLCGVYAGVKSYVADREEKEQENEEEEEMEEVVSISSDDIKSLKFLIDKIEVTFEKRNDVWIKSDEEEFPVNQDKLEEMASQLESIEADRVLEDVENYAEYDLDQPSNTITVTENDGEETVIHVGMENDSTSQYYIDKGDDKSTVYVVSSSPISSFMSSNLYDFAESGTFPAIDSSTISKIQVDGKESSYTLELAEDGSGFWNVTNEDGDTEKADSGKVTSLSSSVSSMAFANFINYNCEDFSQYGLNKPYAEITLDYQEEEEVETEESDENTEESITEDTNTSENSSDTENSAEDDTDDAAENADTTTDTEENSVNSEEDEIEASDEEEAETILIDKQLVIQIGDESDDDGRYVRLNDSNEVYTISNETLNSFIGKKDEDFWDMTVSYLSVNDLESLVVNYQDDSYTINVSRETSEEDDTATETLSYDLDGETLDSTTFTTYYNKLINMTAQKRLDEEEYDNNSQPDMIATFTKVDGSKVEVEYYSYDTNYYAAVTEGKVYMVNKMTVREMFTAFESVIGEETDTEETDSKDDGIAEIDSEKTETEVKETETIDSEKTNTEEEDKSQISDNTENEKEE